MAELLRIAFQDELGHRELAWLQEMETLGRLTPLAWLLGQASMILGSGLTGFVWEENGRIVGNVTISRLSADNWLISNVAVHPDYRRRGIARSLMDATLDWIRDRNARWAILQVRHGNLAAKRLYLNLGFIIVDTTTEMQRRGVDKVLPSFPREGYLLRHWRARDSQRVFALAHAVTPDLAREIVPLRKQDYEVSWASQALGHLARFLGLSTTLRWVVEGPDQKLVATLKVRAGYRQHHIDFMVHPQARGRLEKSLVSHGLIALRGRRGNVYAEVDTNHIAAVEALKAYGFQEVRTLDRMALRFSRVWKKGDA